MAQHNYVLANNNGAAFRADDNAALAAIVSNNSGATEPATKYAYQWWADTTTGILKQRDSTNAVWINILTMSTGDLVALQTNAATSKATPVGADALPIVDSAASNVLKKLTFTNLATYLSGLCSAGWNAFTASNLTGTPAFFAPITTSLGADVALNNVANYFDGPSVAQGTSGKWFVSGTVTLYDTALAVMQAKLWDGTTIISSGYTSIYVGNLQTIITLSGFITSPAGNLRISVKDATTVNGKIQFNASGNSKDSTITAIRVG